MLSSIPPTSHLASASVQALMRQISAQRQHELDLQRMLAGCGHVEDEFDLDTIRPGKCK